MATHEYRCDDCRSTSPRLHGSAALAQERQDHRRRRHGGHRPDGERVVTYPFRLSRDDKFYGSIVLGALLIIVLFRFL